MLLGNFAEYKGYIGSIEYELDDTSVLYGKLLNTDDLVNYQGENILVLYEQYIQAIEDYIAFRKDLGLRPRLTNCDMRGFTLDEEEVRWRALGDRAISIGVKAVDFL